MQDIQPNFQKKFAKIVDHESDINPINTSRKLQASENKAELSCSSATIHQSYLDCHRPPMLRLQGYLDRALKLPPYISI